MGNSERVRQSLSWYVITSIACRHFGRHPYIEQSSTSRVISNSILRTELAGGLCLTASAMN